MATERKYAMTRLPKGYGYVLPGNDGETIWWIRSYLEDGSLVETRPDGRERQVVGTFWEASRFLGTVADWQQAVDRMSGWDDLGDFLRDEKRWRTLVTLLPTRAAAIREALEASPEAG